VLGGVLYTSCVGTPGAPPVAVAFTVIPAATPPQLMLSACAPGAAPVVHTKVACPDGLVVVDAAPSEPPPCVTLAVTPALGTGLPPASVTTTTIGASGGFTASIWLFPFTSPQVAGFPTLT